MGGSSSRAVGVTQLNNITATIFTNVALSCSETADTLQDITVNCTPTLTGPVDDPNTEPYENQPQCQQCMEGVRDDAIQQYNLQVSSWGNGLATVNMPVDQNYQAIVTKMIACGQQCKACSYLNLNQSQVIRQTTSCQSLTTIQNTLIQQLNDQITQNLTNNTDFLAPLAQMLGASTMQDIVTNISSRMDTKLTLEVQSAIRNQLNSNQVINYNVPGIVNGSTQSSSFNSVTRYLQKTNLMNTVFSENTVDDLGNGIVAEVSDFSKMTTSVVGKVVIFMVILLGVVVIAVCLFALVQYIRREVRKEKLKDAKEKAQTATLPAFQQF
jgi:hypothetical protein